METVGCSKCLVLVRPGIGLLHSPHWLKESRLDGLPQCWSGFEHPRSDFNQLGLNREACACVGGRVVLHVTRSTRCKARSQVSPVRQVMKQ